MNRGWAELWMDHELLWLVWAEQARPGDEFRDWLEEVQISALVGNEPPLLASPHETAEQPMLPGMPRGITPYQMNFRETKVIGGGRGGSGRDESSPAEPDPSPTSP